MKLESGDSDQRSLSGVGFLPDEENKDVDKNLSIG